MKYKYLLTTAMTLMTLSHQSFALPEGDKNKPVDLSQSNKSQQDLKRTEKNLLKLIKEKEMLQLELDDDQDLLRRIQQEEERDRSMYSHKQNILVTTIDFMQRLRIRINNLKQVLDNGKQHPYTVTDLQRKEKELKIDDLEIQLKDKVHSIELTEKNIERRKLRLQEKERQIKELKLKIQKTENQKKEKERDIQELEAQKKPDQLEEKNINQDPQIKDLKARIKKKKEEKELKEKLKNRLIRKEERDQDYKLVLEDILDEYKKQIQLIENNLGGERPQDNSLHTIQRFKDIIPYIFHVSEEKLNEIQNLLSQNSMPLQKILEIVEHLKNDAQKKELEIQEVETVRHKGNLKKKEIETVRHKGNLKKKEIETPKQEIENEIQKLKQLKRELKKAAEQARKKAEQEAAEQARLKKQ